jgi:hypothetical protein
MLEFFLDSHTGHLAVGIFTNQLHNILRANINFYKYSSYIYKILFYWFEKLFTEYL